MVVDGSLLHKQGSALASYFEMPRGIPNAKRDESGFRYTTFHVPLVSVHPSINISERLTHISRRPNPKHVSTTYLKAEAQTLWARNARKNKAAEDTPTPQEQRSG